MYERRERVGEVVRRRISEFILKNMEGDTLLSITRVLLTKDLKEAKVYISCLGEKREHLKELEKKAHIIRAYLAKNIKLRKIPSLSFFIEDE